MSADRRKRQLELWQEMQQRIVEETSAYLTECLKHPELAVRIPIIQADTGRFPPSMATAFWDRVLGE